MHLKEYTFARKLTLNTCTTKMLQLLEAVLLDPTGGLIVFVYYITGDNKMVPKIIQVGAYIANKRKCFYRASA